MPMLDKFFLATPELSCLAREFKSQFGFGTAGKSEHPGLGPSETGQKLYEDYVEDRINGDNSLWSPVKKQNNKMFMSGNLKSSVKLGDKTVDLRDQRSLWETTGPCHILQTC